ncbi:MAG: helix-turn-helix transcriptional regulator [Erysipelothrix sp.]|jgi:DNA-binding transcriptional regulator YiaG|nr:helix-turn-helix transcriptional regulator [Erysipelothrix sp.]
MDLAETIKLLRGELQITQEELAHSIHVSFSTVNRWENKKAVPNRMARVLLLDFFEKKSVKRELIESLRNYK